MTNIDDIFERGNATDLGEFFAFKNVGDRIAGTYVDLLEGIDGYNNEQYIAVLKRDGVNHRVAVRKSHQFLVDKLKGVRLGQIIGFSFDEERPNQGRAATKIINLKQDPTMVDEAWIQTKLAAEAKYGLSAVEALVPEILRGGSDAPAAPAAPAASVAEAAPIAPAIPEAPVSDAVVAPVAAPQQGVSPELLGTIKTLLVNKGILTLDATDVEVQAKAVEIGGMPFTAENSPAIINKIATAGF